MNDVKAANIRNRGMDLRRNRPSLGRRLLDVHSALVFLFLYVPIIVLVVYSFNASRLNVAWTGFTFSWYGELMEDYRVLRAAQNSLAVAAAATAASTVLGTLAAFVLERPGVPGRRLMEGLLYLPVILPEIVMGVALLSAFSLAGVKLGMATIILAHIAFCTPFVAIVVRARLKGFDANLERAAMDLGAGPWLAFRHVTLPIIMPGIAAGALLATTLSLDDFIISFFTTGPGATTLPLHVYSMVKFGVSPKINALSTLMILLTVILGVLFDRRFGPSGHRGGAGISPLMETVTDEK